MSFKYFCGMLFVLMSCSPIQPSVSVINFNDVSVMVRDNGPADRETSIKAALKLAKERCLAISRTARLVSSHTGISDTYDRHEDHLFACE